LARITSGWIASSRRPMDTTWERACAAMSPSRLFRAYILPNGSWSPKRLIGMSTSRAVTSKVLSTGPLLRQLDAPADVLQRIEHHYYDAGHMMYTREADLMKLKADLAAWLTT